MTSSATWYSRGPATCHAPGDEADFADGASSPRVSDSLSRGTRVAAEESGGARLSWRALHTLRALDTLGAVLPGPG